MVITLSLSLAQHRTIETNKFTFFVVKYNCSRQKSNIISYHEDRLQKKIGYYDAIDVSIDRIGCNVLKEIWANVATAPNCHT